MATAAAYWDAACRDLAQADPALAPLIARHRRDVLQRSPNPVRTLANAVVGQQISVRAAERIWERLTALAPAMTCEELGRQSDDDLRGAGLSWNKVACLRAICGAIEAGTLAPNTWQDQNDTVIRAELLAIRGVGPWTADMVMIFFLNRPDILPIQDIGLVNAAFTWFQWEDPGTLRDRQAIVTEYAERWQPWRTVATWYLWRNLDAEPVQY